MQRPETPCGCGCHGHHPIDVLVAEHACIVTVLDAMQQELGQRPAGEQLRLGFWLRCIDFLEEFADHCHHQKEERLLFPALERAGLPVTSGPTGCLRHEHEYGRLLMARVLLALERPDRAWFDACVRGYLDHMRKHIDKEEQVLFPMARRLLGAEAVAELQRGIDRFAAERAREPLHARYRELARELQAEVAS